MRPNPPSSPARWLATGLLYTLRFALLFALPFTLVCVAGLASADPSAGPSGKTGASPLPPRLELPSLPESAAVSSVHENDVPQLHARLLVSSEVRGARRVGVLLDLEPGWHVYWRNPGGTGIAPELGLEADAHNIGVIDWPAPQTFEEADGLFTTWGYESSVLLSAPLAQNDAEDAASTPPQVRSEASVLICRTQCVPANFSLSSPLDPHLTATEQAQVDRLFEAALAQVPIPAEQIGLSARAHWTSGSPEPDRAATLELELDTCAGKSSVVGDANEADQGRCPALAERPAASLFLPIEADTFEYSTAKLVSTDDRAGRYVLGIDATRLESGDDRLWGLVPMRDGAGRLHHIEIDVSIGEHRAQAAPIAAAPSSFRWMQIFLLAMLGGLILNGMPCVLPVLAIKVVAVADMAEKDPRDVRLHGLAYTAGVMGSMALLALVVLGLRAAGHSVGWGFQFQEPLFVAVISAILVTFALNLFGVFEIELGQGRLATIGQESTGYSRSIFEGLLAVVLATPCTAPFLGTAVGFAFASSGFGIAAIFLAIGLGLASPFLLVSFFPACARFIPRSGPWMNTLRAGLGFSLLATVVWLLWVLGQSGGASAVVAMTGMLLFLGFLLWGFGQLQPIRSLWLGRGAALAIAGLAFAGFNLIEFDRSNPSASGAQAANASSVGHQAGDAWQTYTPAAVDAALAAGRPAFVVFTADWCITCKVNESTVLERDAIRNALAEHDVALFKADWTRRDEAIRLKLAQFGRAGVPLYLVYRPDRPNDPEVLSELLSQKEVLTALAATRATRRI